MACGRRIEVKEEFEAGRESMINLEKGRLDRLRKAPSRLGGAYLSNRGGL